MANVAVSVNMTSTYIPFERPSDPQSLWTVIPRGLRGFRSFAILAAKPMGDTETVAMLGTLPANYAYIFSGIHFRLSQDRANDWNKSYSMNLDSWYQGQEGLGANWLFGFDELGRPCWRVELARCRGAAGEAQGCAHPRHRLLPAHR